MTDAEREALIISHLDFVHYVIWKYYPGYGRNDEEDIYQIGCLGLVKAANSYDPNKYEFTTYAGTCIHNEIGMHLRNTSRKNKNIKMVSFCDEINPGQTIEDIIVGNDGIDTFDLDPFIKKLTKLERDYVVLAIRGYNKTDIAREMGVSKSYVSLIFKRIHQKWDSTYNKKENGNDQN